MRGPHGSSGGGGGGGGGLGEEGRGGRGGVDADCGGDRPRAGAGARGAERDARAAGGDETGGCADVELALARDAVAAAPARDTDRLGRRGERAVGAARTAEGEGPAPEGEAGGASNIHFTALPPPLLPPP